MNLKIAGINYEVVFLPSESMNGNLGLADFNRQRIMINSEHTDATQKIALYHEIMHIISDAWGLGLSEQQVKIGTHAFLAFLNENQNQLQELL